MTSLTFYNGQIASPEPAWSLTISGDVVSELNSSIPRPSVDLMGGYLLPGFIDTQVNGGGGALFNDAPTVSTIERIGAAHVQYGTTSFLPTLISDDLDVVDAAMRAVEDAILQGIPGVIGIHIEGPFLNVERKGIHNAEKFRTLDREAKALLKSLKRGRTMVTLAPERCQVSDIAELVAAGIVVSAGHSNATYDETRAALAAGVSGFTHLYNAMSPLNHRAPGVVGAALEHVESFCGVILDGHHVHPAAMRLAMRCKPIDRLMLVTDAMPTVGAASKTFRLGDISIRAVDGALQGDNGTLAGSDLDMASALRFAVDIVGATVGEAAIMAATAPARFLGLSHERGVLTPGQRADLVWLDANLLVRGVWRGGEAVPLPVATAA